ncbi:hypothetical protein Chor_002522 [Crotalus horridus]
MEGEMPPFKFRHIPDYAEKLDVRTVKEGDRVTIETSSWLSKERIVDDLIWSQWDMREQRLFYIVTKEERDTLNCIQFYPNKDFQLILEAPLEISVADIRLKSVNLNYSCYQDQEVTPKPLDVHIFTSDTGSLCLCYSLAATNAKEVTYSVAFLHKGEDAEINQLNADAVFSPAKSSIWDRSTGKIFAVEMNPKALLQFLWKSQSDNDKLAALHCLLLHVGSTMELENQIIHWISDNASACFAFDPIQELIIGYSWNSVYNIHYFITLFKDGGTVERAPPETPAVCRQKEDRSNSGGLRFETAGPNLSDVGEHLEEIQSSLLVLRQPEGANEVIVFRIMCQILQAAGGMCLPLPPGFHTLHLEVGMRCFPLHTVLQYIDHGVLHLTEKYVLNLWKGSLRPFLLLTLQAIGCKVCQLWTHSLSTGVIARNYVKLLFEKLGSEQYNIPFMDRIPTQIEFLPLNYLMAIITEMERQGWAASMEDTNMNARLVEEVTLKHTTMFLDL